MRLSRRYEIEAAHQLTAGVPENHKCRRLHGHCYVLKIRIEGEPAPDGMLVEYGVIDATVVPIVKLVDHYDLNTLDQRCSTMEAAAVAKNPTVELLAQWFGARLMLLDSLRTGGADMPPGQRLRFHSLKLREDARSSVKWKRPKASR